MQHVNSIRNRDFRVCVLGTSNAIMRNGWYAGLLSSFEGTVTRFALGGAPFVQLARFLEDIRNGGFDYVILDSTPNDEAYYSKIGDILLYQNLLIEFVYALGQSSTVICLQFPTKEFLSKDNPASLSQKIIVSRLGEYYIPVASMLSSRFGLVADGLDVHTDNYHLDLGLAFQIGAAIGKLIRSVPAKSRLGEPSRSPFRLSCGVSSSHQQYEMSTSLIKCNFVTLDWKDSIVFDNECLCLGFYVDCENSNAVVRLRGKARDLYIASFYDPASNKRLVRFNPLRGGMWMDSLRVVHPSEAFETGFQAIAPFQPPFKIGIESFLFYEGSLTPRFSIDVEKDRDCIAGDLTTQFMDVAAPALIRSIELIARKRNL